MLKCYFKLTFANKPNAQPYDPKAKKSIDPLVLLDDSIQPLYMLAS